MKKVSKLLVCLTAVVCAALALTACGGETGKYKMKTTQGGMTIESVIELKSGGKCEMSGSISGEGVTDEMKEQMKKKMTGTYKIDGEKITITMTIEGSEQKMEGTIKDGVIKINDQEYKK